MDKDTKIAIKNYLEIVKKVNLLDWKTSIILLVLFSYLKNLKAVTGLFNIVSCRCQLAFNAYSR